MYFRNQELENPTQGLRAGSSENVCCRPQLSKYQGSKAIFRLMILVRLSSEWRDITQDMNYLNINWMLCI